MNHDVLIKQTHRACVFALRLKAALKARGKTQKWLAHEAGLSEAFVSRLLGGDRVPSLHVLDRLASVLWVNPGDLWRIGE